MAIPTVIGKVFRKGARKLSQWGERTPSEILKDKQIKDVDKRERRQRLKTGFRKPIRGRIPVRRPKKITPEELLGRTLTPAEQKRWDRLFPPDRKSTRLNSSHLKLSRMPSSA